MAKNFYPGNIPSKPGVYVFRNSFGKVIYVGKAVNLRKRMSNYFTQSSRKTANPKLRSLINSISDYEVYQVNNEDEALILESKLIKEYSPKYNVLMRDDKRYYLLKINPDENLPRLSMVRLRKKDNALYFGPFPRADALKATVHYLRRYFKIRACPTQNPGEKEHKHCTASRVRDCCEPCIGKTSREEYLKKINELIKVLNGNTGEIIRRLRRKMEKESEKMNFEKAAETRDVIDNIISMFKAKNRSFIYASIDSSPGIKAVEDLQNILKLKKKPLHIEGFDNSNIAGTVSVSSMVVFNNGKPNKSAYRRYRVKTVKGADDFATMSEVVYRRYSRLVKEQKKIPDLILIDGGKGQLSAAVRGLHKSGAPPIAMIGLAKKNEEIFIPGSKNPLVIDKHRPALKLLQAVRDEAHRFAVAYHRKLRDRRINESILDDIEGIGEKRKKQILNIFGSIRKLRKASVSEIKEKVPGIGKKVAEAIKSKLIKH